MEATRIKFHTSNSLVSGLHERRVFGCVDGLINGELRGWIINLDRPGRMEHIICTGPGGESREFCPLTLRTDVNGSLGLDGVFGFSIPVALLAPLGGSVSVTDQDGRAITNGDEIALPDAVAPAPEGLLNIFLHISKTAGTSLRNTLLGSVPAGEIALIYPGATPGIPVERFHHIPLRQREGLRWVFGHCKFGLDRFVTQPSRYITFIRDPRDRLRSNFAHHAAAGTVFDIEGEHVSAATVINEGLSEEFDNVMTRVISGLGKADVPLGRVGEDEVELAMTNIRRHFTFVGRNCNLGQDTYTLQTHLGLPVEPLTMDNVTPSEIVYPEREVASVDWAQVMARNAADQRLYERLEAENLLSRILRS